MSDRAAETAPAVFYDAVLKPHRSLPSKGFAVLMLVLDGALVYLAFGASYRQARQTEALRLTEDSLTVERVSIYGERRRWRFQPFWLRVRLEEQDEYTNRLVLTSHGSSLAVGTFLGPAERRSVAGALKD